MLLFSFLCALSGNVLNGHTLPCVDGNALGQAGNFRRVKCANEVVVDFKALRPALAHAIGLIDDDFFHQLIENGRGKLLNVGVLFDRSQEAGRAVSVLFRLVNLRLQSGDFLF